MKNRAPSTSDRSEWCRSRQALNGVSALTHLFNRLDGSYPGRFRSAFTTIDSIENWKSTWEAAFIRKGIQPHEVVLALERMHGGWPPSLPEFLELCRPPLDPEHAYYIAIECIRARQRGELGNWPHPAMYWAAVRIGQHDMLSVGYGALKGRWANAWRDEMTKASWEPIPMPSLALPTQRPTRTSNAEARLLLATLKEILRHVVQAAPKQTLRRDLRWARRILEKDRQENGRPPAISVQMAERALRAAGELVPG